MKLRIIFIIFLSTVLFQNLAYGNLKKNDSTLNILKKVAKKLESLKTVKLHYKRELNYLSEGYQNETSTDAYLDFTPIDKIINLKYQFENKKTFAVYNGSESFELNKSHKTITVKSRLAASDFKHSSFLYNSLATLKNALPRIIADDSIPKSIEPNSTNQDSYVINFILDGKTLDSLGNYEPVTSRRKFIYHLTVRRGDYLPVEILMENDVNKDYTKTSFSKFEINQPSPASDSWFYSSYLNEYKFEKKPETELIKIGADAPDWTLPRIEKDAMLSRSQLQNKVTLLEFWISNCGYCIAAVPVLNELQEKYKDKNFKLIAINADDSADAINSFKKYHKIEYDILYEGQIVAKNYGVVGFPTVVLINRSGEVIYSGVFNELKIREIIDKNLE